MLRTYKKNLPVKELQEMCFKSFFEVKLIMQLLTHFLEVSCLIFSFFLH